MNLVSQSPAQPLWNVWLLDNRLWAWLLAVALAAAAWIALRAVRNVVAARLARRAARTATHVDDIAVELLRSTRAYVLLIVAFYLIANLLAIGGPPLRAIRLAAVTVVLIQLAVWGNLLIRGWISRYADQHHDAARATTLAAFGFLARLALWSFILLVALDNVGVNVTALIAGLGVTGVAVALAVQNILGDLFASLSIVIDKPFVLGDFIVVDTYMGTVEYIGVKTTRLRSVYGEQIVFSNTDLLKSRIRNYHRMDRRLATFTFALTYENAYDTLLTVPKVVREIIDAQPHARFQRAHFKGFRDFALDFDAAYYVDGPDYSLYLDTQQAINLALFRRFHELGIEFAHQATAHTQPLPPRKGGSS